MLTKFELELAARLLDMAADEFSNHGCNDFYLIEEFDLQRDELIALDRRMHEVNGDPEEHDPQHAARGYQNDSCLMNYMEHRLMEEATGDGPTVSRPREVDEIEKWRTLAAERRGRVSEIEAQLDALCSKLSITRRDAERLVEK